MEYLPDAKSARLLKIYFRLVSGQILSRPELAGEFGVSIRSIQRDMEALRCFLAEEGQNAMELEYSKSKGGYWLRSNEQDKLTRDEILAVCKILLETRSLVRQEMIPILQKLVASAVPVDSRQRVEDLIGNERFHYIEPHHGKKILHGLWELGEAIQEQRVTEITYERLKDRKTVHRRVLPVGLMFSEYYFYLTAFLEDRSNFEDPEDLSPTIYRLDRILSFRVLKERFRFPDSERFEPGQFRKRVQFMYGGKLRRVRFRYTGPSIEAVLDRLPTAVILSQDSEGWDVEAEVYGSGIEMWLRSQGEYVELERH